MYRQENNPGIRIWDIGIADYSSVLELQKSLHKKRYNDEIPDTVLILEHEQVVTLGARESKNNLVAGPDELAKNNIDVVQVRRGGGVTAHNPGQLVFYPVISLKDFGLGINEYIRTLEGIGIELLGKLGVEAKRKKGFVGLWVDDRKIASVGVRVSKQVAYHGMAVNISNDLSIFDNMIPCGIDGVEMTSVLKETAKKASMEKVKNILCEIVVEKLGHGKQAEYKKFSEITSLAE